MVQADQAQESFVEHKILLNEDHPLSCKEKMISYPVWKAYASGRVAFRLQDTLQ